MNLFFHIWNKLHYSLTGLNQSECPYLYTVGDSMYSWMNKQVQHLLIFTQKMKERVRHQDSHIMIRWKMMMPSNYRQCTVGERDRERSGVTDKEKRERGRDNEAWKWRWQVHVAGLTSLVFWTRAGGKSDTHCNQLWWSLGSTWSEHTLPVEDTRRTTIKKTTGCQLFPLWSLFLAGF